MRVDGVKGVDDGDNNHNETSSNAEEEKAESHRHGFTPSNMRMVRTEYSLCENNIHDKEKKNTGVDKHPRGDGETCIPQVRSPRDTQHVGGNTSHAKAKQQAGQNKLVRTSLVDLENRHVEHGAGNEQAEKNTADRVVDGGGRSTA